MHTQLEFTQGMNIMKRSDFAYYLPEHLIAQHPLERRDASRLLTCNRLTGEIGHRHFYELPELINPGDCLVMNDTRVIPARLIGEREGGISPIEVVLLVDRGDDLWECLTRPGRKTRKGTKLSFGNGVLTGTVEDIVKDGNRLIRFEYDGIFLEILEKLGTMPLPPYIKEKLSDPERYQTVYSKNLGSAAAPTAGLHFTPELLKKLKDRGISLEYLTLHVGLGTFRPVKEENITDHIMHSEYFSISETTAEVINKARKSGGRVIPVGTTSCRTLETVADENGIVHPGSGWTDIFIYPGYKFKATDALITNFHLPESTLMMLVSALASRDFIMKAYEEAVKEEYRFFSFGDAMFII